MSKNELPRSNLEAIPSPILLDAWKTVGGWVTIVKKDGKFCDAMEVLKAYQAEPTQKEAFGAMLPYFACLAVPRKGGAKRKTMEKIWASKTGKTWKALKEFPARLGGIADEVEKINKSDLASPLIWMREDEPKARIAKDHFQRLPGVLRFYAAFLRMLLVEKVPATWERHFPSAPRGHSHSIFHLSQLIKASTGRFHDREVCDLLDAAACALGVDYQFDPTLLAQARSRHARKRQPA
jgi:hypothetical protein